MKPVVPKDSDLMYLHELHSLFGTMALVGENLMNPGRVATRISTQISRTLVQCYADCKALATMTVIESCLRALVHTGDMLHAAGQSTRMR